MLDLNLATHPMEASSDVKKATCITNNNSGGFCVYDVVNLSFQHLSRDLRVFDRKHSPKSTTILLVREVDDLNAIDVS